MFGNSIDLTTPAEKLEGLLWWSHSSDERTLQLGDRAGSRSSSWRVTVARVQQPKSNSSDPADLQAWCDDCEQMFLREEGKTTAFLAFNKMSVVCDQCYGRAKQLHTPPAEKPN